MVYIVQLPVHMRSDKVAINRWQHEKEFIAIVSRDLKILVLKIYNILHTH